MKAKAYIYSVDECRTAYWEACAIYEATRSDAYSNYTQIGAAAKDVERWRKEWVKAVQRQRQRIDPTATNVVHAIEAVCAETGEDVLWVAHRFNKRIGA